MSYQRERTAGQVFEDRLIAAEREVQVLAAASVRRARGGRIPLRTLAAAALVLLLASSVSVLGPGERGVIQTLGRYSATAGPGVNFCLPWPIQQVDVVDVQGTRRVELDVLSVVPAFGAKPERHPSDTASSSGRYAQRVALGLVVEYQVADPVAFVLNVRDPERVVETTAEVALSAVVGRASGQGDAGLDYADVQSKTHALLQGLLDTYGLGVRVIGIRVEAAEVPDLAQTSSTR